MKSGKNSDLTRTAKSGVNIIRIFIKILEYLHFSIGRCCIVFGENRNSLNIQNSGPKFSKFPYLSEFLNIAPIPKQNIFL